MTRRQQIDKSLFFLTSLLIVGGLLIFLSASLGLLARPNATQFKQVALKQTLYAGLGVVLLILTSHIPWTFWRKAALPLFIFSLGVTMLVFSPIGLTLNGARRWISVGPLSFQPAEFLKFAYIVYLAAWLARTRPYSLSERLIPFATVLTIIGIILLAQPNTGMFVIIALLGVSMLFYAGAPLKHIFIILIAGILLISFLAYTRPYVKERITTYLFSSQVDVLDEGYQIQQSKIAVGSGGILGKGFGKSTQKFNYLPEPTGDSIFAVAAEEFGFLGASTIVLLFLALGLKGLFISYRAHNLFPRYLAFGITMSILITAYFNISAILDIIPLSGIPIPFISQGGTALVFVMLQMGILLSLSRRS